MGFDAYAEGYSEGEAERVALERERAHEFQLERELEHERRMHQRQWGQAYQAGEMQGYSEGYEEGYESGVVAEVPPQPAVEPALPAFANLHLNASILGELGSLVQEPSTSLDTDAQAPASGPKIVIDGDLRVVHQGGGIEVYFTLRNDGDDLPEQSGLQTYLQVVDAEGNTLVDRRVGMGLPLARGETHFGGDKLSVAPQRCTVFVYTNYKDDGTYDDIKSADYQG